MNLRRRLLITVLLLPWGAATGAEWVVVSWSVDDKLETLVDVSSIRITGGVRRAWSKFDYAPQTRRGADHNASKWIDYSVSRYAFNCAEELSRLEALTQYFEDGTNDSVPATLLPLPWEAVLPETLQDYTMKYVCEWKPEAG